MKKLLLTTSMFLAMNAWSLEYHVCEGTTAPFDDNAVEKLEQCVNEYLERGFGLHGDMVAVGSKNSLRVYQPMYKF